MNTGQYIAIVGGLDDQHSRLRNVEVVIISDEGVVSPSTCQLPDLQVAYAAISGNLICGGRKPYVDTTKKCQELSPEGMKWEERNPMKKKTWYHAMTNANNQTYVCGGEDESWTRSKSCEKLNGEWSFIKDLPIPLSSPCMIGTDDSIYVIGGSGGSGVN